MSEAVRLSVAQSLSRRKQIKWQLNLILIECDISCSFDPLVPGATLKQTSSF